MADIQMKYYNNNAFEELNPKTKGSLVTTSALGSSQTVDGALTELKNSRFYTGSTAPSDTKGLWIDNGVLKYYNESVSPAAWVPVISVWG